VHGAPKDPHRFRAYVYELTFEANLDHIAADGIRVCFFGHTHVQMVYERTADGRSCRLGAPGLVDISKGRALLVNPGSVGQPRDSDPRAAFAIWDREHQTVSLHRVPYAIGPVVESIRKLGLPEQLAARLTHGE
jgi:diadenosine tetraphosphatase ApaH/serine/threonine PP2A family protein phosphatase